MPPGELGGPRLECLQWDALKPHPSSLSLHPDPPPAPQLPSSSISSSPVHAVTRDACVSADFRTYPQALETRPGILLEIKDPPDVSEAG